MNTRPEVDVVTREVIYSGLLTVANEMSEALGRSAYSPIIREMIDYSCAIFDPAGDLVAQAENIPAHLGSMGRALGYTLEEFPPESFRPGDAYISNDPYRGGSHTPDVHIFTPAFSGDRLIGICGTIAHQTDMGGKNPGTEGFDNRSMFEEGLQIPPLQLIREGETNEAIFRMIAQNVREPDATMGDLRAQLASCRHGERRLAEFVDRYDADILLDVMRWAMDYSETRIANELTDMRDGTATASGWLDDDGVGGPATEIRATVTVSGDRIAVDLTGTGEQLAGGMNVPPAAATSAVIYAVKCMVDPESPQNEGVFRRVDVTLPEGSVVNPVYPAAVSLRHLAVQRIADTILKAMAELYPERAAAGSFVGFSSIAIGSFHPVSGEVRVIQDDLGGGMGASQHGDGLDTVDPHLSNVAILPAEVCEQTYQVRILGTEMIPDSAGPGEHRGGLGMRRTYEFLNVEQSGVAYTEQAVPEFSCWGLDGGGSGTPARIVHQSAGQEPREIHKGYVDAKPGDRLVVETAGGGGYGDPRRRDRERVARDVAEGKVSPAAAQEIYGFEMSPPTGD